MSVLEGAAVSAANGAAANTAAKQGAAGEAARPAAAAPAVPAAQPAAATVTEQNQVATDNNVAAVDPTLQDQVSNHKESGTMPAPNERGSQRIYIGLTK